MHMSTAPCRLSFLRTSLVKCSRPQTQKVSLCCTIHNMRRKKLVDDSAGALVPPRRTLCMSACNVALVPHSWSQRPSWVPPDIFWRCCIILGGGHRRDEPVLHAFILVVLGVLVDEIQLLSTGAVACIQTSSAPLEMRRKSSFAANTSRRLCLLEGLVSTGARNSQPLHWTMSFAGKFWRSSRDQSRLFLRFP